MVEKAFLNELARMILCVVHSKKYPKLERDIMTNTNFNRRVFSSDFVFRQITKNFIRFILNMAMVMGEKDFKAMGHAVVDYIWEASDDGTGDDINKEHCISRQKSR